MESFHKTILAKNDVLLGKFVAGRVCQMEKRTTCTFSEIGNMSWRVVPYDTTESMARTGSTAACSHSDGNVIHEIAFRHGGKICEKTPGNPAHHNQM